MAKIAKGTVILAVVAFCGVFLAGHFIGPTAEAQADKVEQVEDPYKYATVLVEAFVAEVELMELYDLGVSPIGEKPDSVSIENILRCLQDKDRARIIAGAKVAVQQKRSGNTSTTTREMISEERQRATRTSRGGDEAAPRGHKSHNISKSFEASVNILPDGGIEVGFGFSHVVEEAVDPKNDAQISTTIKRQWSGTACLVAGKPSIAGATQDGQKTVFLILCADIKGK